MGAVADEILDHLKPLVGLKLSTGEFSNQILTTRISW
jgi:hypothetical protein